MRSSNSFFKSSQQSQRGAALVEYGLILALMALIAVAAIPQTATGVRKTVCGVMNGFDGHWIWNDTTGQCENIDLFFMGDPNWLF